jgi:hypothetical protein
MNIEAPSNPARNFLQRALKAKQRQLDGEIKPLTKMRRWKAMFLRTLREQLGTLAVMAVLNTAAWP